MTKQSITILDNEFTVHRFEATEPIPPKIYESKYYWIGKTEFLFPFKYELRNIEFLRSSFRVGLFISTNI
ncbi:MAG: hypothetical protein M0Q21_05490 [Ignavibacteriaceae bacterium]|nr:hypothetical protein [Ignavibacteriaceae bacterium]